jgi:hypothetical protein
MSVMPADGPRPARVERDPDQLLRRAGDRHLADAVETRQQRYDVGLDRRRQRPEVAWRRDRDLDHREVVDAAGKDLGFDPLGKRRQGAQARLEVLTRGVEIGAVLQLHEDRGETGRRRHRRARDALERPRRLLDGTAEGMSSSLRLTSDNPPKIVTITAPGAMRDRFRRLS